MTLKWCGFGSVLYSLFDTVSLNNLKLSKDILLGDNFHTNFAVISNTFGLIIFFVLSISLKVAPFDPSAQCSKSAFGFGHPMPFES